jgi:hypothetical protein
MIENINPEMEIWENFNRFKEKFVKNQLILDTNKKLLLLTLNTLQSRRKELEDALKGFKWEKSYEF